MVAGKQARPMKSKHTLSGVACDSSCTEPCSSFEEITLSPTHTMRVYRHYSGDGISYVFTNCSDGTWTKTDGCWFYFRSAAGTKAGAVATPLLTLHLDGVVFESALSADARGLQLLISCQHFLDGNKDPNGSLKIRFASLINRSPRPYPDVKRHLPDQLLRNHSENLALVFLSTIVLYHLLSNCHMFQGYSEKYNETIFVVMIQCVVGVFFQLFHCIAFPILFYRRIHEYVMDFVTFMFLVSGLFAIYFTADLPYTDWVALALQLFSLSVCVKVCLERKESTF